MQFYCGKKILITGHTGFKGSWLCKMLVNVGAKVTGYSLPATTEPNLFAVSGLANQLNTIIGDIRDLHKLKEVFKTVQPEIVIHLAAQPLVLDSYKNPLETYEVNVMGTVNILECIRQTSCVKSFLNITTDKVYHNREWVWGYREDDPLDGFDPYSNSKSCSELVTNSYKKSFFNDNRVAISTARSGNVIGGGDFSSNRIIPDCIRAAEKQEVIKVRNPQSIRPYQHVLEPLIAYLTIVQAQYDDIRYAGYFNVGPDDCDCITTGELADLFCELWGEGMFWKSTNINGQHEANFLKLDCSKMKQIFGWKPVWRMNIAMEKVVEWTKIYLRGGDVSSCMNSQIKEFLQSKEAVVVEKGDSYRR